jgi:hypothetical protein
MARARHRSFRIFIALVALLLCRQATDGRQNRLPASIPDAEFWSLIERLSEPTGVYPTGNPLSNELFTSSLAAALALRARPEGVYVGVGREQNFHYIAASRARLAFLADLHRANWHLHLLYKALFELSADRAEFVSRLFTKPRPAGLTTTLSAAGLIGAYWHVPTSAEAVYKSNLQDIFDLLTKSHRFPLGQDDLLAIERTYHAFYWHGPLISHTVDRSFGNLMLSVDYDGREQSFLSSEPAFAHVRTLHQRNLIVPVIADLAGSRAIRAIGDFLRDSAAVASVVHVSGTPAMLTTTGRSAAYCANLAAIPVDERSVLVRPDLRAMEAMLQEAEPPSSSFMLLFPGGSGGSGIASSSLARVHRKTGPWADAAIVPFSDAVKSCR